MPRIRTIKPEFWSSEQVMECSMNARLLFIGLWNFCDDAGRHPVKLRQIKAQIFPGDEISLENVRGLLDELSGNGLITLYSVDNQEYFTVTGWHHQRIDKPQDPKYPPPPDTNSENNPGTLPPDRKGKDRKGKELYEFEGSVIRITKTDYERWEKSYPALDLRAELQSLDDYYANNDPGRDWFHRASGALKKRNEAKRKGEVASATSPFI